VFIKVKDAGKVAGITYVHGIGNGLLGGLRIVFARFQIFIKDVIGIVGCNETLDRQSHPLAEQPCGEVPEIT
jgi:hypothetical protein